METFELSRVTVAQQDEPSILIYSSALLHVISEGYYKHWFVEINNLQNRDLLQHFSTTDDIKIEFAGVTPEGQLLSGEAFLHPNLPAQAAAIRGHGELLGYTEK